MNEVYGYNKVDEVFIEVYDRSEAHRATYGVFVDFSLPHRFSILTNLTYRHTFFVGILYNPTDTASFPFVVHKVADTPVKSIIFSATPTYSIPLAKNLSLKLLAGACVNFNWTKNRHGDFNFKGRHPRVAAVIQVMNEGTVMPVTMTWVYGLGVEYWRFALWAKWQHESDITRYMEFEGERYAYRNKWRFLHLTLTYKLFTFNKAKGQE